MFGISGVLLAIVVGLAHSAQSLDTLSLSDDHVAFGELVFDLGEDGDDGGFVCVCLDWWPSNKCDYGICPWRDGNVLDIDLKSPNLVLAMKQLGRTRLRIGGTQADTVTYEDGMFACEPFSPSPLERNASFFSHGCLKMQRWKEIVSFCREHDCKIVFGINAMLGRNTNMDRAWNSTNAANFLKYIEKNGHTDVLFGFELGNELNLRGIPPTLLANDYREMHQLMKATFGEDHKLRLIGCDFLGWQRGFMEKFLEQVKDILFAATWHAYPLGPSYITSSIQNPMVEKIAMSKILHEQLFHRNAKKAADDVARISDGKMEIWIGESGGAFNSGKNNTSNRFIDSFWYLDSLGGLALHGHRSFCRQTLVGGNYGLLRKGSLLPNPDFFAATMFKRYMGRDVLAMDVKNDLFSNIRAYGHCNRKESFLTLLVINFDGEKESTVHLDAEVIVPREEFHFTSDELKSKSVFLNGKLLNLEDMITGNQIEEVGFPVKVAPHSYTFIVWRQNTKLYQDTCHVPPKEE